MEILYLADIFKDNYICVYSNKDRTINLKSGFMDSDTKQFISLYIDDECKQLEIIDLPTYDGLANAIDFVENYKELADEWGYELSHQLIYNHDKDIGYD